MGLFTERPKKEIAGVISCYDRILIPGTLPGLCDAPGMTGYFYARHIRHNRCNVAEKLGFLGRPIHGPNPRPWVKELKARLGEVVGYAEASD